VQKFQREKFIFLAYSSKISLFRKNFAHFLPKKSIGIKVLFLTKLYNRSKDPFFSFIALQIFLL